jgi:hypothetical protein
MGEAAVVHIIDDEESHGNDAQFDNVEDARLSQDIIPKERIGLT